MKASEILAIADKRIVFTDYCICGKKQVKVWAFSKSGLVQFAGDIKRNLSKKPVPKKK